MSTESTPIGARELRRSRPTGDRAAGWQRWLPGLGVLREYRAEWFPRDLLAGLVLSTMLVPVGIAYAEASGVPGINGLYATILCLLAYALFGPSRIMVLGPDSSLVPVVLAVVAPIAGGDPARAVAAASAVTAVSGIVCLVAGLARLGFITELISKPIRYGYMNGIALAVTISQLPKLLGISIDSHTTLSDLWQIVRAVTAGHVQTPTLAVGLGTLAAILALKRHRRVPGILIAMVAAMIVVTVFDLADGAGVKVLGSLPRGLPTFGLPWVGLDHLRDVVIAGCAVALVAFADTSVLSRAYAARMRTRVDASQEMIGLGAANLATGLFHGIPVSSSSTRTPVAEAAGSKTQLTGVIAAVAVTLLLVLGSDLLKNLPIAALAAVVISSAIGLLQIADLGRIHRIQRWEFWLSIACMAGVVAFGAIPGIALAVVIAVIEFLWDGWRPHFAVLGRVDGVRGYHDVERYPDARLVPGLVLFRWDAPLFFANAEQFQARVLAALESSPTKVRRVVVAAEPVTSIDVTSADMLAELDQALEAKGIELAFAEMKDPVKDKLKRFELFQRLGEENFHPTVSAAVDAYLTDHGVAWEP